MNKISFVKMMDKLENVFGSAAQKSEEKSEEIAKKVVSQIVAIVKEKKWQHAEELINILREFGRKLVSPTNQSLQLLNSNIENMSTTVLSISLSLVSHQFPKTCSTFFF